MRVVYSVEKQNIRRVKALNAIKLESIPYTSMSKNKKSHCYSNDTTRPLAHSRALSPPLTPSHALCVLSCLLASSRAPLCAVANSCELSRPLVPSHSLLRPLAPSLTPSRALSRRLAPSSFLTYPHPSSCTLSRPLGPSQTLSCHLARFFALTIGL